MQNKMPSFGNSALEQLRSSKCILSQNRTGSLTKRKSIFRVNKSSNLNPFLVKLIGSDSDVELLFSIMGKSQQQISCYQNNVTIHF